MTGKMGHFGPNFILLAGFFSQEASGTEGGGFESRVSQKL
jgi:hypothetical protein